MICHQSSVRAWGLVLLFQGAPTYFQVCPKGAPHTCPHTSHCGELQSLPYSSFLLCTSSTSAVPGATPTVWPAECPSVHQGLDGQGQWWGEGTSLILGSLGRSRGHTGSCILLLLLSASNSPDGGCDSRQCWGRRSGFIIL